MRHKVALGCLALLGACGTTVPELREAPPKYAVPLAESPKLVAACVVEATERDFKRPINNVFSLDVRDFPNRENVELIATAVGGSLWTVDIVPQGEGSSALIRSSNDDFQEQEYADQLKDIIETNCGETTRVER